MTVTSTALAIVPMTPDHAEAVLRIYGQGIEEGQATFERAVPEWAAFDAGKLPDHRFVAVGDGEVLGWVAVSATSKRACYAGVVEESVYVGRGARGRGVGAALLRALIDATEAAGIWTINAGIFPENEASIALHERLGFRVLGRQERVACHPHTGMWRDVILMERRSRVAG
jgi:L-amino acid N-acyltransferase YncA